VHNVLPVAVADPKEHKKPSIQVGKGNGNGGLAVFKVKATVGQ
jgi:hypothetical protein